MSFFLTSLCGLGCVLAAKSNLTQPNCRYRYRIFFGPGFDSPRLHQMRFQKNYVYVDDGVFGFVINAADYLKRHFHRGVS